VPAREMHTLTRGPVRASLMILVLVP
jgi:hypothetical protein